MHKDSAIVLFLNLSEGVLQVPRKLSKLCEIKDSNSVFSENTFRGLGRVNLIDWLTLNLFLFLT